MVSPFSSKTTSASGHSILHTLRKTDIQTTQSVLRRNMTCRSSLKPQNQPPELPRTHDPRKRRENGAQESTPTRPSHPHPRPPFLYHPLPHEMWSKIHEGLSVDDLKHLSLVSRHVGGFAQASLWRRVRQLSPPELLDFAKVLEKNPDRATQIRSLQIHTPSYEVPIRTVVDSFIDASPRFQHLNEFKLTGNTASQGAVKNILADLHPAVRLLNFRCDSDTLTHASWATLSSRHRFLEEFTGFLAPSPFPARITPNVFPNLRVLRTSSTFLMRLQGSPHITHLAVCLAAPEMPTVLHHISAQLGAQLLSLRLERTFHRTPENSVPRLYNGGSGARGCTWAASACCLSRHCSCVASSTPRGSKLWRSGTRRVWCVPLLRCLPRELGRALTRRPSP